LGITYVFFSAKNRKPVFFKESKRGLSNSQEGPGEIYKGSEKSGAKILSSLTKMAGKGFLLLWRS